MNFQLNTSIIRQFNFQQFQTIRIMNSFKLSKKKQSIRIYKQFYDCPETEIKTPQKMNDNNRFITQTSNKLLKTDQ